MWNKKKARQVSDVYLLDTDHMTLLERGGAASEAIKAKLR